MMDKQSQLDDYEFDRMKDNQQVDDENDSKIILLLLMVMANIDIHILHLLPEMFWLGVAFSVFIIYPAIMEGDSSDANE